MPSETAESTSAPNGDAKDSSTDNSQGTAQTMNASDDTPPTSGSKSSEATETRPKTSEPPPPTDQGGAGPSRPETEHGRGGTSSEGRRESTKEESPGLNESMSSSSGRKVSE